MLISLKLVLLIILTCLWICCAVAARNTLNQGEKFNSSHRLVSKGGLFTLLFIKQEYRPFSWDGKDFGFYLAIQYTDSLTGSSGGEDVSHPIWLANREDAIADESGALIIDATGLKITRHGGNPIQLFSFHSTNSPTNNISLVLQGSGNLVLQHYANNSNITTILWQSFDYPTDTFLPGMKLGFSRDKNWSLSSWLSQSIPAPGAFNLKWDPLQERLVVWLRDEMVYWTSGENLANIRLADSNKDYNFTKVSNGDEQYVHYTLRPTWLTKYRRMVMNYDGDLYARDVNVLDSYFCAGDSTKGGCERWEGPKCRSNGDKYEMKTVTTTYPSSTSHSTYNKSVTLYDCKDMCWKDCKCLGVYAGDDYKYGLGCHFLIGPYVEGDIRGDSYQVITRPQTEKSLLELMTSDEMGEITEFQDGNNGHNLNIYSPKLINSATNCFSPENLLGKGGFGPVFKGTMPSGQAVAIKRLSRGSGQGLVEFKNELILIAKLQHTNLVRLLGFCIQGEEKMLVYEYMPNKSLDFFIFDESKRKLLDWSMRFRIIEGIAQGLLYLHKYSRLRIIHRDLKLSNILLDENMNPKISDFGMARIYKTSEVEPNTNRIVGTYGYMAPEYAMEGTFSVKSDVYSFGVMMLEIVSGKKNTSNFQFDRPINLVGYAWELWKHGASLELVDPTLKDSCSKNQVLKCITLGLLCVEDSPLDRPTMSDVISMLNGEMQLPLPKRPAFSTARNMVEINSRVEKEKENYTINGLSMSEMDAR
ncbi:hypothetical protein COLO4_03299 [Corchorus olitorius]|uniref:Receptor-like serine/threonine-protein kinase n=1 Tax=Corchorus olitorius TaxID=93759 RepID=A0A1R3KYZ9_9ROSI|nr:hypothetical protein COLO4_03299 [Corchorus olitorius]